MTLKTFKESSFARWLTSLIGVAVTIAIATLAVSVKAGQIIESVEGVARDVAELEQERRADMVELRAAVTELTRRQGQIEGQLRASNGRHK